MARAPDSCPSTAATMARPAIRPTPKNVNGRGATQNPWDGASRIRASTIMVPTERLKRTVPKIGTTVGSGGRRSRAGSSLNAIDYNGRIPTVINYSAGIQAKLPYATTLEVGYVGSVMRHLMDTVNLNAIPYGADFQAQNQDPTKQKASPSAIAGSNAYDTNFLAPYQGYGTINYEGFGATTNYNSMQVKMNRDRKSVV